MVLFSWFLHAKKSLNDIQAQEGLQADKQQDLIYKQQAMWPIAKPREQAISLSPNIIRVSSRRHKKPIARQLKYKQILK
ncbi:hypothetical protein [Thalassomonas haliotis]|uniref:Uncharacterized protein n=1 Tax=Thalassomonas haliotis TaxID=485448 RepID=A0ABY7V9P7_9GAMM|nr:hypothetical protein [Thalassomonas haliotis]WDE10325.1 hypothetical protein H3N35_18870 [Thalassomonas haliotis]